MIQTQTQIQDEYLLAQASENCRQVMARNGLNVRRQPTANSEAIGIINSGRNVTIQSLGENGWVPITAPVKGYVYGGFLGACEVATAPPPTNCRQVAAVRGINVHQAPSTDGERVGAVANGRRVKIESLGTDGWVPITLSVRCYL
ncbi:MAG: SH3 domain-containing protein [Cyanobacteria bacterium 0813]|nr:SH3 domain-containing protein [Cyanobacteria bacterium 0813]